MTALREVRTGWARSQGSRAWHQIQRDTGYWIHGFCGVDLHPREVLAAPPESAHVCQRCTRSAQLAGAAPARAIAVGAVALAMTFAVRAFAATWLMFHFTAPADLGDSTLPASGIARYRMESWSGARWDSVRIYSAPSVEGVPPASPGSLVALYVSQSTLPQTSKIYRLSSIDARGNVSEPSNRVVRGTGFPDTVVGLVRVLRSPIRAARARMASGGFVNFDLAPGDTAIAEAWHQERIQQAFRARLCQLYGYWCLRGARQACPAPPAAAKRAR
jgi:hypothetical protein